MLKQEGMLLMLFFIIQGTKSSIIIKVCYYFDDIILDLRKMSCYLPLSTVTVKVYTISIVLIGKKLEEILSVQIRGMIVKVGVQYNEF